MRMTYLLFLPAWGLLAYSLHLGNLAQRDYVAYLFRPPEAEAALSQMNADAYGQIRFLEYSLFVFGFWLVVYLIWWIFSKRPEQSTKAEV